MSDKKEVLARIAWNIKHGNAARVRGLLQANPDIPVSADFVAKLADAVDAIHRGGWSYSEVCFEEDAVDIYMGRKAEEEEDDWDDSGCAWESSTIC